MGSDQSRFSWVSHIAQYKGATRSHFCTLHKLTAKLHTLPNQDDSRALVTSQWDAIRSNGERAQVIYGQWLTRREEMNLWHRKGAYDKEQRRFAWMKLFMSFQSGRYVIRRDGAESAWADVTRLIYGHAHVCGDAMTECNIAPSPPVPPSKKDE